MDHQEWIKKLSQGQDTASESERALAKRLIATESKHVHIAEEPVFVGVVYLNESSYENRNLPKEAGYKIDFDIEIDCE